MPVAVLLGVLLIASFIFNAVLVFKVMDNGVPTQQGNTYVPPTGAQPTQPTAPTQPVEVELGDAPTLGDGDATVTVIEFSDFECPFCGRYYTNVMPQLKSEYVDTGKVLFAYKQFPLTSIHPNAFKASEAALCADDQDKFWEYHDALFEGQQSRGVGAAVLPQIAAELELDVDEFNECLSSGKYANQVRADMTQGEQAGVTGTPTTFVNGVKIVGAVPYETIKAEIERALAQ